MAASAPPASHRRQHRHRVAVLHRRLQPAEETHVFVVDVDVDEAPQPGSVHQALAQPAVPGVKVAEEFGERGTGTLDRLGATGVGAQDGRDTDLDGHERRSWVWAFVGKCGRLRLPELQPATLGDHSGPEPAAAATIRTSSSVTAPSTMRNERNSTSSGSRVETST